MGVISLEGVKKWRNMPWLKRGMAVEVNGKMGRVTSGNRSLNINVRFDSEQDQRYNGNCHPTWETRYFGKDGKVIADYRSSNRKNPAN